MELKINHLKTDNKLKVTMTYVNGSEEALTVQYLISFLQVHGSSLEELSKVKNILMLKGANNEHDKI